MIARIWKAMLAAAPVKIWAQIGGAAVLTLLLAVGTWAIWRGPWASQRPGQQLDAMFYLLVGVEVLVLVALAAITGLNVSFKGGRDGVSGSIDQDEHATRIETVTKTTVTPPDGAAVTTTSATPGA
ncbi:MAG: hypothetical protein Q8N10_03255 [Phenylobacterium sp.]|uniref:hypothetical protein n=1 Tax=Phenylobacterium sp. TaxID=1871053 RepID=UPI00271EFA22|nr:hypothetical protein [Phenylobacterium sp.]MDO8912287.1 hypothetical protein [Phenylobacterium sp.]MDP3099499.1 hypothetical protein [Phenylobacterium sp.]